MEVLAFDAAGLEADETPENANAVVDVDDVVAGRQRRRQRTGFGMAAAVRAAGLLAKPEDLQIGQEQELRFRSGPAAVEVRRANLECPGGKRQRRGRGVPPPVPARKDVLLFEELRQPVDLVGGDGDAPAVCQALPHVFQHDRPGDPQTWVRRRASPCRLGNTSPSAGAPSDRARRAPSD